MEPAPDKIVPEFTCFQFEFTKHGPASSLYVYLLSEPKFSFDQSLYHVDESVGSLEVKVWKTGSDLSQPSSVTVQYRRTKVAPAEGKQQSVHLQPRTKGGQCWVGCTWLRLSVIEFLHRGLILSGQVPRGEE